MADTKTEEAKTSKFLDFFNNKITKIVAWTVLFIDLAVLIIGGTKAEEIDSAYVIIGGIIGGIATLIAFITSKVNK